MSWIQPDAIQGELKQILLAQMTDSNPSIFTALQTKMKWAAKRQKIIAQNIANADTPGFVPKDLRPVNFNSVLKATSSASIAMTNPKHMNSKSADGGFSSFEMQAGSSMNNNGVDLEAESLKMAKTKDEHAMATSIYRKWTDMLKLGIGRPTGQ